MTTTDALVDVFVDAGVAVAHRGPTVARAAADSLAAQLIADGHGEALAEMTAAFWTARVGDRARRDRWAAYGRARNAARAGLDPGEKEPPPPPDPAPQPEPQPDPPPPPTKDRSATTGPTDGGEQ